jgi:23S rRNA pseudouridine2605 synthase
VTELGTRIDPERQKLAVDGENVALQVKRYYLLNKPTGYLCTNYDPSGRPRAIDLVPARGARLFTVGRLDESSEGLLLVTNDGDLANRLAHPRYQVARTYRAQVLGNPTLEVLDQLQRGLRFEEGLFKVQRVRKLKAPGKSTYLELELRQGQNREIRRLFARVGHKVLTLKRIAFGPLQLGRLEPGEWRPLNSVELSKLRQLVALQDSEQSQRPRHTGPKPGGGSRKPGGHKPYSGKPGGQRADSKGAGTRRTGASKSGGSQRQSSRGAARGTGGRAKKGPRR